MQASTRGNKVLLAGDINARHSMWGDKIINEHVRISVDASHDCCRNLDVLNHGQPTFVSVNGNSITQFYVFSENLKAISGFNTVDQVAELFTRAPARTSINMVTPKGKDNEEGQVVKDFEKANWNEF